MSQYQSNCCDDKSDREALVSFGKEMRKKHFLFAHEYVNLNQGIDILHLERIQNANIFAGAFGSHPRQVQAALRSFQDEAEAEPDKFIRYTFPERLDQIRARLGRMLNVATDELVLVPNATTAINT